MAHVDVEIGSRLFRLTCEAGQEARIRELAGDVGERVRSAAAGRVGSDAQMLLIAAIQIADELRDVLNGREELAARGLIASAARSSAEDARVAEAARMVDDLVKRVETVVSRLDRA